MTTATVPNGSAYTLFCDDIRQEQGQKYAAMGVYVTQMVLDAPKKTLDKFVALTILELPISDVPRPATISLMDGDKALVSERFAIPADPPGSSRKCLLTIPIEAIPFEARAGMKLQVRISMEDYDYCSAQLDVAQTGLVEQKALTGSSGLHSI
ncbi:MAG: hypothetical protein V4505_10145 [Pseudomonadota bacterium]